MQINKIGEFEILEQLQQQGRFGKIFLGSHQTTQQKVAVKVLDCKDFSSEEILRLKKEGSLLDQLKDCPHIAQVMGFGEEGDYYYVATEYIDGITLREWIDSFEDHRPPFEKTAFIIAQIAEGLSYAHEKRIVHRDIKPSNIILRQDSLLPVIVDFGVGICAGDAAKVLRQTVLGTPAYMAAEILKKIPGLRTQADIYSLGLVFHEMLIGEHPCFDRISGSQLSFEHSSQEVYIEAYCQEILSHLEPPRSRCPEIDRTLSDICERCTDELFRNRYATATDLANDLNQWIRVNQPSLNEKKKFYQRKSVYTLSLIGSLLLIGAILLGQSFTKSEKEKQAEYFNNLKFRDTFDDPLRSGKFWRFNKPDIQQVFSHRVEPSSAHIDHGRLVLVNRGYLVTIDELPYGASITFKWMWKDGQGKYCDDLCVALRTSGIPQKWPHEVEDGITIRFSPHIGQIIITEFPSGKKIDAAMGLEMNREKWHKIRITDDGKTIRVFYEDLDSPTIQITSDHQGSKKHIAIYNREPVSAVNKKSVIDDVVVHVPSQ